LSTLEAAASGCALVLGNIPSLRENWSDAALFVDPHDPQALASAIQGAIDDPIERRRLGLRAMACARQYTVTRMAHAYVDAYQHVLSHAAVAQS
jgi:glycosyltransferase involved in cell wall biosynthesis